MKLTKPIAESPIVKRMPPKKLQPSNLLPPLPEGSTGVSVLVGVGATVGVVGAAVGLVVGAAVVVVVELKCIFLKKFLKTKLENMQL